MSEENILEKEDVGKLLRKFAIPSVVSMLVISLYNIVDQFFIGQKVGSLGNAATNVSFPIMTMCIALMLTFGIGSSAGFNINMGAGNKKLAKKFVGCGFGMLFISGTVIAIITELFLPQLLMFCGSTKSILPFAVEYMRIIAIGFPFVIFANGGAHLVRADGSPVYSMLSNMAGAITNTILDYIFVMKLDMGMTGAAIATVIGQVVSFVIVFYYMLHYKTVQIEFKDLIPKLNIVTKIVSYGMAQGLNQLAMMLVQVVINKSLKHYGDLSVFGPDIPLSCLGVVMKINQLYFSVCIGISQGMQPIASFNVGAGKFDRVKKVYKRAFMVNMFISCIAFVVFQIFPREIMEMFSNEKQLGGQIEVYYQFAVLCFRVFLLATFVNGIQPLSSTFCTSVGESTKGTFLSLTRQFLYFMPLIIVLPMVLQSMEKDGIYGILYSAPIADFLAFVTSIIVVKIIFKKFDSQMPINKG